MTAYILTEQEQHAQIVDALEIARTTAMDNVMAARIPECGDFAAIAQNLDWSVATLKAMKPVTPTCYGWRGKDGAVRDCTAPDTHQIIEGQYNAPLYAKEQQ